MLQALAGAIGAAGPAGVAGALGPAGLAGLAGAIGAAGPAGLAGLAGALGAAGLAGATGPAGPAGPAGGLLGFADFFALMPGDNAATVAPGTDVDFPQNGPTSGTAITRSGPDSFNLAEIGTYQVMFQVSVTEPGQLILTLNGADLAYTVVGRATDTSQIVGIALVQTAVINSILTVRNPAGNSTALTITPLAGGTRPVSAHLVITRIA
ncbi:MAG: collagen-like protein [Bacillota bacterium]